MKKLTILLLALIASVGAWAQVTKALNKAAWTITALNTCVVGKEGAADGNIRAAIDGNGSTFYHSSWEGGDAAATGNKGIQGFLIDMQSVENDLVAFSFIGRFNDSNYQTKKARLYVYETLPEGLPADLGTVPNDEKDAILARTNTALLGMPVYDNAADPWTYAYTGEPKVGEFAPVAGRYVLFLQDDGGEKGYLCCTEFEMMQQLAGVTYTVSCLEGGIIYEGQTYTNGASISVTKEIAVSDISAAAVEGKYGTVAVSGNKLIAGYSDTAFDIPVAPLDRTGWYISAQNAWNKEPGTGDCNARGAIVPGTNSWYHSDYSGSQPGNKGPQGFLVDMGETMSNLVGISYVGRGTGGYNHATKVRVYVYETLPEGLPRDLSTLSVEEKNAAFDAETGILGTPAFENSANPWSYSSNTEEKVANFSKRSGRYVLFVSDEVYNANNNGYLTCSSFNVLAESASLAYTVSSNCAEGGVTYYGCDVIAGDVLYTDHSVAASEVSAIEIAGKVCDLTITSDALSLTYYYLPVVPTGEIAYKGYDASHTVTDVVQGYYIFTGKGQSGGQPYVKANDAGTDIVCTLQTINDNNALWYFSPYDDDSKWYIYNMGAGKYLEIRGTTNGGTVGLTDTPTILDVVAYNEYIAIKNAAGQYVDVGAGSEGTVPVTWNGGLAGSSRIMKLFIASVDTPELAALALTLSLIDDQAAQIGTQVGQYTATTEYEALVSEAKALTGSNTVAEINAMYDALVEAFNALPINMPEAGKYYQIVCASPAYGSPMAIYAQGTGLRWMKASTISAFAWTITPEADGTYTIRPKDNPELAIADLTTGNSQAVTLTAEGTAFRLNSLGAQQFNIVGDETGRMFHTESHNNGAGTAGRIVTYPGGAGSFSSWYILDAPEEQTADYLALVAGVQGIEPFQLVEGANLIYASEISNPVQLNADIEAVDALTEESTVEEIKAVIASGAATRLSSMQTLKQSLGMQLVNVAFEIEEEWSTIMLPCWGGSVGEGRDWPALELYSCDEVGDENVLVIENTGSSFDYNAPYIMKGTVGDKYQVIGWNYAARNSVTTATRGLLTGVFATTQVPEGSYVLQHPQGGRLAFYEVQEGQDIEVSAGEAYLTAPSEAKILYLPGADAPTAISALAGTLRPTAVYNLSGQRLARPAKGINIQDGKKFVVK